MICAVALMLLLDASGSVGSEDWRQQVVQTAAAIESQEVIDGILRAGPTAVAVGAFSHIAQPMLGWRILQTEADARQLAADLRAQGRPMNSSTDIAYAIRWAANQMEAAPCDEIEQRIIDVSTDGEAPEAATAEARDEAQATGIRINVIGVGAHLQIESLRQNVVTYDGFLIAAESWDAYPMLFRRKLIMELTAR